LGIMGPVKHERDTDPTRRRAMKTVALDVHARLTQMSVCGETGEILLERRVETTAAALRREIGAIPGPKRVVFENGPLAGLVVDAVAGVAEEVISCDPTQNALIAGADDSNDENDAQRLGVLSRAGALKAVYVPAEPFRTLRELVCYETRLTGLLTLEMLQIKALCRRHGVAYRGKALYARRNRGEYLERLGRRAAREHLASLYRMLDAARTERVTIRRELRAVCRGMPLLGRLLTIPGIGPVVARVLVAWIVDPGRFKSRSALAAYAGLGLKQDISAWQPYGRAHASKRGQRQLKRVLFLAARAVLRWGESALARRYAARRAAGWEDRKAIRDVARQLLFVVCHVWRTGEEYDDARISVPAVPGPR